MPSSFAFPESILTASRRGCPAMRAFVVITTEHGKSREIARRIAGLPGVKMADACWGSHDVVVAVIEFRKPQALNKLVMDKIQTLEGVRETNTHIAFELDCAAMAGKPSGAFALAKLKACPKTRPAARP